MLLVLRTWCSRSRMTGIRLFSLTRSVRGGSGWSMSICWGDKELAVETTSG